MQKTSHSIVTLLPQWLSGKRLPVVSRSFVQYETELLGMAVKPLWVHSLALQRPVLLGTAAATRRTTADSDPTMKRTAADVRLG